MSTSIESSLAEFIATTDFEDIPDDVIETVKRAFVDTVGVTLAGTTAESGKVMAAYRERNGVSTGDLLGNDSAPVTSTALAAGTAAHALDYDDLSWAMDGHPSIVLIPPILAIANHTVVTGEEAITAYAVGYEVACSVAEPISPTHYEAGWHASSTFGTFGATAAAAVLLDLDTLAAENALNIAASMPSGIKRNFGSMTKPLHAGLASRSGVTAAQLAKEEFSSGIDGISGDRGFWELYSDERDDRVQLDTDTWYLVEHGIHVKRYPCCYFTHSSIAAVQDLVTQHDIVPGGVDHVDVHAAGGAIDALAYASPETGLEAKFSMQHAVAVGLTRDTVGLEAFERDTVENEEIRAMYDLVDLHKNESLPYDSHAARVEISLANQTVTTTREHPPWVHNQPPTTDELRKKFLECATRAVDTKRAEQLYDRVSELPATSVTNLLRDAGVAGE